MIDQIQDREYKLNLAKENENLVKIGHMASQVAHDIRPALAVLNAIVKQTVQIPEQQRIMLRNAALQINDIANNLLSQHSNKLTNNDNQINNVKPDIISILIDSTISEKRAQFNQLPININFYINENAYRAFVNVVAADFRRVISNIIQNAIEAIKGDGEVSVHLSVVGNSAVIKITDSGVGMKSELIDKIMNGEGISCKKGGFGIGLKSSINFINSWDGQLTITSQPNLGTTVQISLPLAPPAEWFANELIFSENSAVVILDDDQSVHDIWRLRIQDELPNNNMTLIHLYKPNELLTCNTSHFNSVWYLFDYEFIGDEITGLDLIRNLNLNKAATLVTSHDADNHIRHSCIELGVKILPKNYSAFVPIKIDKFSHEIDHLKINEREQADVILIDDNKIVTDAWQFSALHKQKKIVIFNNLEDVKRDIYNFDRAIPIYIDSNLGGVVRGEQFAKILYEEGFVNIYLTTGYKDTFFDKMYWIKDIIGKESIFG